MHEGGILTKQDIKNLTVRLPSDLHARIVEIAREKRWSLNTLMVWMCEEMIKEEQQKQESEKGKFLPTLLAA